jgi:hypothetical protein
MSTLEWRGYLGVRYHVLESRVLAQHSYWSVGRGLADARARGRILLRLKIILDEGGWAHARRVARQSTATDRGPAADCSHARDGVLPVMQVVYLVGSS